MQVVPLSKASRAPNFADHSIVSRSNALSSFHQTELRISPKELGNLSGDGIPRANEE